jgi:hypothetical protein
MYSGDSGNGVDPVFFAATSVPVRVRPTKLNLSWRVDAGIVKICIASWIIVTSSHSTLHLNSKPSSSLLIALDLQASYNFHTRFMLFVIFISVYISAASIG